MTNTRNYLEYKKVGAREANFWQEPKIIFNEMLNTKYS